MGKPAVWSPILCSSYGIRHTLQSDLSSRLVSFAILKGRFRLLFQINPEILKEGRPLLPVLPVPQCPPVPLAVRCLSRFHHRCPPLPCHYLLSSGLSSFCCRAGPAV